MLEDRVKLLMIFFTRVHKIPRQTLSLTNPPDELRKSSESHTYTQMSKTKKKKLVNVISHSYLSPSSVNAFILKLNCGSFFADDLTGGEASLPAGNSGLPLFSDTLDGDGEDGLILLFSFFLL